MTLEFVRPLIPSVPKNLRALLSAMLAIPNDIRFDIRSMRPLKQMQSFVIGVCHDALAWLSREGKGDGPAREVNSFDAKHSRPLRTRRNSIARWDDAGWIGSGPDLGHSAV